MTITAAIKITQGSNTDVAGNAVFGDLTSGPIVLTSVTAGATTGAWEVIDSPPGSAIPIGIFSTSLAGGSVAQPDKHGGYLFQLTASNADPTQTVVVQLALVVKELSGRWIPPFRAPDGALTFGGSKRGWSPGLEDWLHYLDALGVTSVFGRTGAIVATAGDYADAQIVNTSTVSGAHVNDALTNLKSSVSALVTGVSSAFGRSGAVVATAGDYTSTQVTNSSGVTGSSVTAALNTLNSALATAGPIASVFGRTGAVVATVGDYTSNQVSNASGVTGGGATVTSALNSLQSQITGLVAGVASIFGRTGAVVAVAGDYTSTQVNNVSGVTGTTVTAALNTLNAALATAGPIVSVFGRTGVVVAVAGDYTSNQVNNSSGVTGGGASVTSALNSLQSQITGLVLGVSSVFGRAGAVVASNGDYTSTQVTNSSAVTGATVTAALNTLNSALPTAGPIVSVFGRTGVVAATSGDYTSTQVTNSSSVTGTTVTAALNALNTAVLALVTGVSSVFGRSGTVVAVSGDYTSTLVTNSSGVTGASVTAALNTLNAALPTAGPIVSVFGRTGTVAAVSGDYTSSLVSNSSGVTGGGVTVTSALNSLQSQISAIVSGVSSVFGRTGAVIAASGDYTSTLVTNSSSVVGTTVTAALNTLNSALATAGPISSVFGRVGAVVAVAGDYTDALINNTSTVTGTHVKDALTTLKTSITALVTGVSSVFGRAGAVVAVSGDYTSTLVTNSSAVTGATVTAALNTLNSALPTAGPIVSVFGRTGTVAATAGDYTSTLVTNSSAVTGATVTAALNTLNTTIAGLVTGVSSVFGRSGTVVAVSGDYNSTKITNSSTVAGSTTTDALNALLLEFPQGTTYSKIVSFTLSNTNFGQLGLMNGAGITVTIPTMASSGILQGSKYTLLLYGATATIVGIVGATGAVDVRLPAILPTSQYTKYELLCLGGDEWRITATPLTRTAGTVLNSSAVSGFTAADALNTLNVHSFTGTIGLPLNQSPNAADISTFFRLTRTTGFTDQTPGAVFVGMIGPLPLGVTIDSVSVWIFPPTGHSALPASMPTLSVYATGNNFGSPTPLLLATATDASASVAAYETFHELACPLGGAFPVTELSFYFYFTSEHNLNSKVGLLLGYASMHIPG